MKTGKIIVITAPSGSGKTTLVKRLLRACPRLEFSISACTREPRVGESHSRDYYFYSEAEFKKLIEEDAFVEWEMVYAGKYYGTLKSEMERIWSLGKCPVVDIDVQGALAISKKYPDTCKTIFIKAPSLQVLRERLHARGTETPHSLEERITKAATELTFAHLFDHVLVNRHIEEAANELINIVKLYGAC